MEWERGDKVREKKKKKKTGSFDVGISNITKMYQISWIPSARGTSNR
jgi:hypothetical protein